MSELLYLPIARQNCIKAARKWALSVKKEKPSAEGELPDFWKNQFGYNIYDIVFEALPDLEWPRHLRLEPDIREELFDLATRTAVATWCEDASV